MRVTVGSSHVVNAAAQGGEWEPFPCSGVGSFPRDTVNFMPSMTLSMHSWAAGRESPCTWVCWPRAAEVLIGVNSERGVRVIKGPESKKLKSRESYKLSLQI